MARYEISISPEYVKHWTPTEAVREIFQNALDQQATDWDAKMTWGYNPDTEEFWIASDHCKLNKGSLLLGASTKADDSHTIGQFGEGYKLAALVLVRTGHTFTVLNNMVGETWTAKIIRSKKFQSDLLVFDTSISEVNPGDEDKLIFRIGKLTRIEYERIKASNLHIRPLGENYTCEDGSHILLDPEFKGKVYVSGLFVKKFEELDYGYDFTPEEIQLDRDRSTIDSFNLYWASSRLWLKAYNDGAVDSDTFSDLIFDDSKDLTYIDSHYSFGVKSDYKMELEHTLKDKFVSMFGEDAVPVQSQDEMETALANGIKPVMVSDSIKKIFQHAGISMKNRGLAPKSIKDLVMELGEFIEKYGEQLDQEAADELDRIYNGMAKNPRVGLR